MALSKEEMSSMRTAIALGARRNRKTPSFIAQVLVHSRSIEVGEGEEWLDEAKAILAGIDMPESYMYQVKSILLAAQELSREGYELVKSKLVKEKS